MVHEAVSLGELGGDVWFAVDSSGHALRMPPAAAKMLGWRGVEAEKLSDTWTRAGAGWPRDPGRGGGSERYSLRGGTQLLVHVRSAARMGFRRRRVHGGSARSAGKPAGAPAALLFGGRRTSSCSSSTFSGRFSSRSCSSRDDLRAVSVFRAAESIGRGHSVAVEGRGAPDELGAWPPPWTDGPARRAPRGDHAEASPPLPRLYRMVDLRGARALQRGDRGIQRAERVVFLHDPETTGEGGRWPGWNVSEEPRSALEVPLDDRAITAMVFQTGELTTPRLERDPYVHRETQRWRSTRSTGCMRR